MYEMVLEFNEERRKQGLEPHNFQEMADAEAQSRRL
jgi:hypothetical protein